MNKKEKHAIFEIYLSNICFCGNKKKALRWVCIDCRKKSIKLRDRKILNEACKKHAMAAHKLIEHLKSYK